MNIISSDPAEMEYKRTARLMGNIFEITIVSEDVHQAAENAELAVQEIKRIERLLTTFDDSSETNLINQQAGKSAVRVSREIFDLINRSLLISKITDGAFDITYGSIDKRLWNFDTHMTKLPDASTAKKSVRLIDYRNVVLDEEECSVMLRYPGMRIGFGGIGKGYAAERAKQMLIKHGVRSGIINASGDLAAWGLQPNGDNWKIGIAHPDHPSTPLATIDITNKAVATSGNYEKFVIIDGQRFSHTINPKTGLPVTGIKSVTVIAPHAEIADALATPVTVMGVKNGLSLIDQLDGIASIVIDDSNNIHCSKNINLI